MRTVLKGRVVRYELGHRNGAIPHCRHDVVKVDAKRIAAADQHHLAFVEFGVGEADLVLDDAYHYQGAAMGHVAERGLYRGLAAGRIENEVKAIAIGSLPH